MTVRKIAGVLPFMMAFVLLQPLGAQTTKGLKWSSDRPDSHAPISLTDDRTLMGGELEFGVKYFNQTMKGLGLSNDSLTLQQLLNSYWSSPTEMVSQGAEVNLMFGVTDDLTLTASGTFAHKLMHQAVLDIDQGGFYWIGETRAFGPEDVKVSALYKVLENGGLRFHVHAGMSIPLGLTDFDDFTLDPEDPLGPQVEVNLPFHQQLGSGSFEFLPGFTASLQNAKASIGIQWKGTIRLNQNDRDWALGDSYNTTFWGAYKASEWTSVSVGAKYLRWGNIEGYDAAFDTGTTLAYSNPAYNVGQSGWRVDVPIGVNFILPNGLFEGHRLAFEFLIPVHQDLEYLQLRHDWTITVGWQKAVTF